ncbi:DUF2000 domain-containing protein [Actinocrinis puniceicyclus]|uniref:DUF2000 domain-containing protein n=1 Tax=Actinocrinis puniceicyclus TaxID=977794 RepID=A0A8J8BFY7_9ACTN|nr:DUF2000 domain-containing protein [Actinocrinis puniceicyclus]MBS2966621.1 DUF2000 domain-containing protein [Actinocrinis puniceicyclus]
MNDKASGPAPDTKIAVVVRESLASWQKLNVTAFAVSGIAATAPRTVGEPYLDASDVRYLPMFGQPVLVFAAAPAQLRKAHRRALDRGLAMSVYPEELFGTFNDEDNRAVVRKITTDDMALAGIAVYGPRSDVDAALKGLSLHR